MTYDFYKSVRIQHIGRCQTLIQEQEATMKYQHFLITCFPIQGHINPTIQLAKNLVRAGARVTFATTIKGLDRVKGSLPTLKGLSYIPFSDGHDKQDLQHAGGFVGYMADLRRHGSENLTKIIKKFTDEGSPVTCLVYSLLFPWAAVVAHDMHVPSAFLAIQCAAALAIYHRFFNNDDGLHKGHIDSSVPLKIQDLPSFHSDELPTFLLPDNPLNPYMHPVMLEHIQELEKESKPLVLVNTFEALEQEAIKELEDKLNVIAIGPLLPSALSDGTDSSDKSFGMDLFSKSEDYFQWLDSKMDRSIVYVAFGSLAVMSKEQMQEILHGLTESRRPFLWVIRSSDNKEEEEGIKKIIEKEVSNVDGIIVPWCSQTQVLSHKSVGCFLTHCGWNSCLESLTCGVPVIGCPQFSDQKTNAKLVEEVWGTGVRARNCHENAGMIGRGELGKCLDVVMGNGQRGKEIRKNVEKWKGLAMEAVRDGGSSCSNLRRLLEYATFSSDR